MRYKYTNEEFIEAVAKSTSIRQVLHLLEIKEAGGNYRTAKNKIKLLELDTSHFGGQGWAKGRIFEHKQKPLDEILIENRYCQSHPLKLRLLKEEVLPKKCHCCQLAEWQGQSIPLELHHVNGIREDNRLENLQLLCPNCHALTDNYRGKKLKKPVLEKTEKKCKDGPLIMVGECLQCNFPLYIKDQKYCSTNCYNLSQRKVERPDLPTLENLLQTNSYCAVGRLYGVSDNAVRKWIKQYKSLA